MSLGGFLESILRNIKAVKKVAYGVLLLMVLLDFVIPREHPVFPWDYIPGFNALYGYVSCALIIVVSKALGHYWLMKREDYYD